MQPSFDDNVASKGRVHSLMSASNQEFFMKIGRLSVDRHKPRLMFARSSRAGS